MSSWPIWSLLSTVFGSILEVFLLCIAGYILARNGILDKKTQKQLNRVNVNFFTPSLLFSKVAFFLTPAKLRELWIIPIVFVVTTSVSMLVAYTFGSILRLKRSQRSFAMAAAMFMNSNSLPIALMQSLVYTVKELHWGDDDDKNGMLGRALTYLVLYSTLGMMLRWSYGVHLLSQADEEDTPGHPPEDVPRRPSETSPLISSDSPPTCYSSDQSPKLPTLVLTHSIESSTSSDTSPPAQHCNPSRLCPDPAHPDHTSAPESTHHTQRYFHSFPNTPVLSEVSSDSELTDEDDLPAGNTRAPRRRRAHALRVFLHKVNSFMTMPMWAALASLFVACVQPLQHALMEHARPIKATLTAAGNCSIPLTLVVLGAYFFVPPPDAEESKSMAANNLSRTLKKSRSEQSLTQSVKKIFDLRNHGKTAACSNAGVLAKDASDNSPGETKTVIVAVLSRMILTPLILLPLMSLLSWLISADARTIFADPVFVLSNVLLITSAPALTLAQITQAASGDAFERLISRTIFWAYCIVTPPLTIISVVVGLVLSKI